MKHHNINHIGLAFAALMIAANAPAQAPSAAATTQATPTAPPAATRTAESAVTPKPFRVHRHKEFMERKTKGPIGLLFLGDSITDHWVRNGASTWEKFAPHQPADFGVSGMRTEGLLWNINNGELEGIHPKAVVVMIGINNILQCPDDKPEWIAAAIQKVVETVHAKIPDTKVLVMGILPGRWGHVNAPPRIEAVNQIISRLDDGSKTRFLDPGKSFLTPKGDVNRDLLPDRLHPNEKGYQIWYDAMQPILTEWLK